MAEDLRPPGSGSVEASHPATAGSLKVWLLLGTLGLAGLLVVLVLPRWVESPPDTRPPAARQADVSPPALPVPPRQDSGPVTDLDAAGREQARSALQDYLRLLAQPQLENAEIWAAQAWSAAQADSSQGDRQFGQGNFAAAVRAYQQAIGRLRELLEQRESLFEGYLESADQALADNELEAAADGYGKALAMAPDHADALLGQQRTAARGQVLELFTAGQQAEISGDFEAAADSYARAASLDPLYTPVSEALANINHALAERAFQQAMGEALAALEQGRYGTAEKRLQDAEVIKPGSPAIADTRERLRQARRQSRLEDLRSRARQAVAAEDWLRARDAFEQALQLDANATYARLGLRSAKERLVLHQQLDHYLSSPQRLYSPEPRDNAAKLLASNPGVPASEPRLQAKLKRLAAALELATTPLDFTIVSDGNSEILVYKVGRLGRFQEKVLRLTPGDYTIKATREGYRDVVRIYKLRPGMAAQRVTIRNEEAI